MFWLKNSKIVIILFTVTVTIGVNSKAIDYGLERKKVVPPAPKFQGKFDEAHEHRTIGIR